ncbi:MAG: hypothetical protein Q8M03_02275, partial [Legionella sp.]|nr:hypothetical protein [Legionella sp.]
MRFGFRSSSLTLGIDIGSFSLKAVKLEGKSSGPKAVKVAYARIPRPDDTGEGELLSLVKELVERNGLLKEHASLI